MARNTRSNLFFSKVLITILSNTIISLLLKVLARTTRALKARSILSTIVNKSLNLITNEKLSKNKLQFSNISIVFFSM